MAMANITLIKNKERRILSGHPWIYQREIEKTEGDFSDGDIVIVKDWRKRLLGQGFINRKSHIVIRLLTNQEEKIDKSFFKTQIESAINYRKTFLQGTNAYRLVFSEGDFLPGLIIDNYDGHIVIQTLTLGMDQRKEIIIEILLELLNPKCIYERNDVSVREKEGLIQQKGFLYGLCDKEITCSIYGIKFIIDIENGQKTGMYLDQKENYLSMKGIVKNKTVLDCFSYNGGFAIASAYFGAKHVLGVDASETAIEMSKQNAKLNDISHICSWEKADVFAILKDKNAKKEFYDVVILDPPSFTRKRETIASALRGYKEINLRALKLIPKYGFLVTCTCSHHISYNLFKEMIVSAASDAGRKLKLVEYRNQSKDHPILPAVPETEYLKCFILQVI
jgi:23S rRNA (cytosine1962-C5)-methyltransferase